MALKTVSRYVNGETNIDPGMMERIGAAIVKLGYRRNLAAASIRPGWTSKTVALISSDLANPYYSALAFAVESTLWELGYLLTTFSSEEDGHKHDQAIDRLIEQRVDALLVVPPRNPGRPWASVRPPVPPVVFLDRPAVLDGAPSVLADNAGGAKSATVELARNGARSIAFVGDSLEIYTMAERIAGYRVGLSEVGLEDGPVDTNAKTVEGAEAAVTKLLHDGTADAIFAANNRAAIGALRAYAKTGHRLPMIAFDDFEAATVVSPAVSVVAQDVAGMGSLAAHLVVKILRGEGDPPATTVLPTELILRGSELPDPGEAEE